MNAVSSQVYLHSSSSQEFPDNIQLQNNNIAVVKKKVFIATVKQNLQYNIKHKAWDTESPLEIHRGPHQPGQALSKRHNLLTLYTNASSMSTSLQQWIRTACTCNKTVCTCTAYMHHCSTWCANALITCIIIGQISVLMASHRAVQPSCLQNSSYPP